ncbi:uncharacterized protein TNCV_563051 [Trichonephila clavipes]|nr:uncharacterized protein TNCV_563051 [Trichonephila clavipes]
MSFFYHKAHYLSSCWNGEPPSMPSVIKPLSGPLDESSNRNAQACCPMVLFSCRIMPPTQGKFGKGGIAEVSMEYPPHSPNLSPYDFHIFGPLKRAIREH